MGQNRRAFAVVFDSGADGVAGVGGNGRCLQQTCLPTHRPLRRVAHKRTASSEDVRVPLVLQPDGTLIVPHNGDRYQRFQAARICEPLPAVQGKPFRYQLTPQSLEVAGQQGIAPDRILQFLEAATGRPIPAGVKRGIVRWGERGVEAKLETAVILRVRDEAILDTLRNNPKTRDYIGESLGELSATVRLEDWQPLRDAVTQLGLLLDTQIQR